MVIAGIDLGAQPADEDIDDVGLGVEVVIPNPLQNETFRQRAVGILHHQLQQRELPRLEVDLLIAAHYRPAHQIERHAAERDGGGGGSRSGGRR